MLGSCCPRRLLACVQVANASAAVKSTLATFIEICYPASSIAIRHDIEIGQLVVGLGPSITLARLSPGRQANSTCVLIE
ncbi:hypothetical protein F4604DRAFT_1259528 [Suillus subluteus]|nr:hypothetical protein F4604DRAFT_1259528 [Suillus subluteus]